MRRKLSVVALATAMLLILAIPAGGFGLLTAELASPVDDGGSTAGPSRGRITVTTSEDTVDVAPGDGVCADANGDCSLRAAVQESNASPGIQTIALSNPIYALSISGGGGEDLAANDGGVDLTTTTTMPTSTTSTPATTTTSTPPTTTTTTHPGGGSEDEAATGDLDITSNVEIEGNGAKIDASALGDRIFDVPSGVSLSIEQITLTGGTPPTKESGGAIRNAGTLYVDWSSFSWNVVSGEGASGGAIANLGGYLEISNSYFSANSATRAGGAIEANAGTTVVNRSSFESNTTGPMPGNGGAFHLTGAGTASFDNSLVVGNTASAEGGGLWNSAAGQMTVNLTLLQENVASGDAADEGGGGLFNDGGTLVVSRSEILENRANGASGSGGGILNNQGTLKVDHTRIEANSASRAGGGVEANIGVTSLDRSQLIGNVTGANPGNGGGLHLTGAGTVTIHRSLVVVNKADNEGGGLWNSATGTMTVTETTIKKNTAPKGPDVFNAGGNFTIDGKPVPADKPY